MLAEPGADEPLLEELDALPVGRALEQPPLTSVLLVNVGDDMEVAVDASPQGVPGDPSCGLEP